MDRLRRKDPQLSTQPTGFGVIDPDPGVFSRDNVLTPIG